MERIIPPGLWVFTVLALLASLNTLATDISVRGQCGKSCWLNDFLFGVLGESGARVALAIIWLAVALFLGSLAYRVQRKKQ